MPGNPNETKLVNFAMANSTRRKIINFLANGYRNTGEIEEIIGKKTLDFHLKVLQQAGLIDLEEETVKLSEYGKIFLKNKTGQNEEKTADFSQAKPVEIAKIRQLSPCIADSSRLRVSANMIPPPGGILKLLEPLFPRSNYSDRKDSLIIQKGEIITTIYGSGKVSIRMIKNEDEAKEVLESLKTIINEAIAKGVAPAPREKVRVDLMEIYEYLPQTNCRKCSEQGCYSFAIKLMSRQVTLDRCVLLKEPEYANNQEHLQILTAYI
ncbi:ArsR family transcriptional regulator [Methanosarcina sp. 2.H.T.1A.6]|uniref:(Fe-S)-binding protein n=1 Tax=unclassified Methanosarcina TaxID=2644672 RepID=UPI000620E8D2|nr:MULTISPECIES: (Fe-S)-binding protein [unclassified Methanosarcina]KKG14328.1 ArsR family transcriptional regulator [Methanosarcina sp. 2.H.T.1A.3]KKG17717.1 ArsR family transcriptional regulator [Methanosarcina sp. 2.H.T.1A.15]KKG19818.1 ArsR family transcriptional regulator [Methanosarcina sp. 2.H.T.1A.6]KKG27201.1 ArsR family transcriptional regulator [Methanosarcina sp. 2.H.T.1A.8]